MPDGNYDPATDLTPVYEAAGKKYGWDPDLLRAQTHVESSDNPYAVSSAGAEGMSQFIPSTARGEGLNDPFDPHESIPAQAKLLRENANQLGSPDMAVAAYHGGTDPSQWGEKTRAYLDAVEAEYQRIKSRPKPQAQQQAQAPAPPAIGDQIAAARKAGYSDDDIASYLQQSKTWAPKFEAARKAGYLDDEVLGHLGLKVAPGKPLTTKQTLATLPMAPAEALPAQQPGAPEPSFLQRAGKFANDWLGEGQAAAATQQAGAIFGAAKQAYQNTPPMLAPMAQAWADKYGLGGDARALSAIAGAFNGVWAGTMEAANQVGQALGQPQLGREAAAMIEHAGLSGAPHGVFHALDAGMTAAGQAAQEARLAEERGFVSPDRGPPPEPPAGLGGPMDNQPPPGETQATGPNAPPGSSAARPQTMEEAALGELNPEWTKPVMRERPAEQAAGAEAHAELENIAEGTPATPSAGSPPGQAPPSLAGQAPVAQPAPVINLGGMGQAIGDNLRSMLWDKLQRGDTTEAGQPSRVLLAAKQAMDAGQIKTPEDFARFTQQFYAQSPVPAVINLPGPTAIPMPPPAEAFGPPETYGPQAPQWQKPGLNELERAGPPEASGPPETADNRREPPPGVPTKPPVTPKGGQPETPRQPPPPMDRWWGDLAPGDRLWSNSGRELQPVPKFAWPGTGRPQRLQPLKDWLVSEAKKEAALPGGEQFWRDAAAGLNPKNLSQSDVDTIHDLLFGNDQGPQAEHRQPPTPAPNGTPEPALGQRGPTPQVEPSWRYVLPSFVTEPHATKTPRQRLAEASEAEAARSQAEEQAPRGPRVFINRIGPDGLTDAERQAQPPREETQAAPQGGTTEAAAQPVTPPPAITEPPPGFPEGPQTDYGKAVVAAAKLAAENPDGALADVIANRLATGRPLSAKEVQRAGDHYYGGKLADGDYGRDRLYDAQELGVNRYIQQHSELYNPTADADTAKVMVGNLEAMKDRLPTQTVRAGEKDTHQQFSTPPDFAYAAAWAANMRPEDRVLEPSAGTGSLAVMAQNAKVAEVTANEISEKRQNMLSHLGVDRLTTEDARQIHNALPDEIKPSVVLMNPPFSAAPGRMGNKMVLGEGAAHVKAALDRLEPGGRLVAIVGRGMTMDAPAFKDWWKAIGDQYDVRANVGVGGKIYQKYGTNFATRLLVIDKLPPSRQAIVGGDVGSAADLIDKLKGVRDDRPVEQVAGEPSRLPLAPTGEAAREPGRELPGATGVVGAGERPPGAAAEQPKPANPRRRGERAGAPAMERPGPGGEREPVGAGEPGREPSGAGGHPAVSVGPSEIPDRSRKAGGGDGVRADGSGQLDEPGVTPEPEITVQTEKAVTDGDPKTWWHSLGVKDRERIATQAGIPNRTRTQWDHLNGAERQKLLDSRAAQGISEAVYENYKPQKLKIPGAKEHPGALVQSAAMASVSPPDPKYTPKLPKAMVTSGKLSNAQLEAVVYAGQAHSEVLPNGQRRGFFIGDGTGVGKGREIAGIIADNTAQGRTKHIWISESQALLNDAKRDWSGIGFDKNDIFNINKVKAGEAIKAPKGILFSTYSTLRAAEQIRGEKGAEPKGLKVGDRTDTYGFKGTLTGIRKTKTGSMFTIKFDDGKTNEGTSAAMEADLPPDAAAQKKFSKGKTRVDQIAGWFGPDYDGVIVFDESHNLGNAMNVKGKRGVKEASQMALAGLELQDKLPNARVVYVSATGATEVSNLAYAERLGLWGKGTAFPDRSAFLSRISSGGIAAMELVARDMKALGHYVARNLSYDGVEYDRLQHTLNPDQRGTYDKLAEGWQIVLQNFTAALKETGAHLNSDRKSAVLSAFWGGHQRFFNQVITSMQMPSVLKAVERDVKEGRQAVLQLVNTNEASQERALERTNPDELEDLDMTPRDQLMQLVEKAYPTQEFETYVDEDGNERSRPVEDSHGNPVHNKEMLAARDKLLDELGSIRVPDGPLEMLLNHFGTDKVAEVTGRKQRVVRKADDEGVMKTVVEKRTGDVNVAETDAFQGGKKPILVFSQAGGTGRSYHADNTVASAGARRSHYLVQPGWRADKAVQGFGRTHRTNQASAPIFHLVTTDLQGQRRFISSIARRLSQLGALTKGERRTGDQGLFGMKDNLESQEAVGALHQLFRDVNRGEVEGLSMEKLEEGMGLKLRDERTGGLRADLPPMSQFLNRLLSLKIDQQNKVFQEFGDRFDTAIDRAATAGTLDTGVETYRADKIEKKADQVVYTDPSSGAETRHVQLQVHTKTDPMPFDSAVQRHEQTMRGRLSKEPLTFVQNNRSGRVYAAETAHSYTDKDGRIVEQYRLTGPNAYQFVDKDRVDYSRDNNWQKIEDHGQARALWDKEVATTPPYTQSDLHLITGAVLPVWDRLGGNPKIYRLQTDAGERMLGRVVPNKLIAQTLDKLGAEKAKVSVEPGQLPARILGGDVARLSNDWTIKPSLVAGERRLELVGPSFQYDRELADAGVFKERIGYQTRYFIPTGDKAAAAIAEITAKRPIVQLGDEYGGDEPPHGGGGGDSLYSFPGSLFDPAAWRRAFGAPAVQGPHEVLRDKAGAAKAAAEIKAGLAPTSLRGAKPMEYEIRAHTSRSAQAFDIAAHRLEAAVKKIDRLNMQEQIASADIHEHGQAQHDPELQAASDALRAVTDEWRDKIQGLGRGYLANAIDNYMAHIWGNYREWKAGNAQPTNQAQAMVRATGRNVRKVPLTGSGNFLKQRFFPTQLEGINAGLVPISYNWARVGLVKIHEMQKFYHGTVLADQIKGQGLARWVRDSDAREAQDRGEVPLDDKIFQPKLYGVTPIGPVEPGKWYAPEAAARIFNNYMSQGWANRSAIYDALRMSNNALNSVQLGIGGFHAAFVTNDTATSKVALGIQQIARAEGLRGAGNLLFGTAGYPAAIVDSLIKGGRVRREWLDPGSGSPEVQRVVEAIKAGGYRMTMPDFFRSSTSGPFFKHWNDLKNPGSVWGQVAQMFRDAPTAYQKAIMTPIRIAARTLDTVMEPLMGAMVPRAKAGVMYDLAADWLRRNPTATPRELSAAMTKFQDSVDNRLGQLNYDNLFWNKTLKDVAFITTRSVGWNLGTIREIGGGFVDSTSAIKAIANGRAPELTTRMAYLIAMPIVTGLLGAVLAYLATGQGPQSLLDYFYPPTGTDTPQGVPDRRSIPGYMKDVFAFAHDPIQTVLNKTAPMIEAIQELIKNRDFYGGIIYDPTRDAGPAQAYGDFLINQATPFSLRSMGRLNGEGAPAIDQALGFFGFQPAPASITNPERGEKFQRKEQTRAYKLREKEVSKGLSVHIFNRPAP